jgi:hypothetical protein
MVYAPVCEVVEKSGVGISKAAKSAVKSSNNLQATKDTSEN